MESKGNGRLCLALAICAAGAACVLPEPVAAEPPPAPSPDQAPIILQTAPAERIVLAEPAPADGGCEITLNLTVSDAAQVPLTARVFVNDGNPAVPALQAEYAVAIGGTSDFPLEVANQLHPEIEQLPDPGLVIPLEPLLTQRLLVTPAQGENFVEVLVSDGFASDNSNPTQVRDPAPGKAVVETFWFIDTSQCNPWEGFAP